MRERETKIEKEWCDIRSSVPVIDPVYIHFFLATLLPKKNEKINEMKLTECLKMRANLLN